MENREGVTLQTSKDFTVPVQRLYEAWTTENDLKQWWRPMDNTLTSMTNELKEGGKVQYAFETAEHNPAFEISGDYKEVKPNERLVYTWNWLIPNEAVDDSKFLLTIRFIPDGDKSKLEVTQENFASEEAVKPHRDGWEKALNGLQQYLS
ncbi:MAG TPA: SRPBCC family protein [Flavisolibacter sp.]|jgi:uncharacterized protein YndB with AHSA1/START domain|nr:SRPBCC family protein [Flavisolibacter sp.]